MKVYTKSGDRGTTSLVGGERVAKSDTRVEAYGTVDELTAFTALLADKLSGDDRLAECVAELRRIESQLMTVAALLAVGKGGEDKIAPLSADAALPLEEAIDRMQEQLPAITKFTIPGGDERMSLCHVCRTVCRRAERAALRADAEHGTDAGVLVYLNRLSDYFYVLGRTVTAKLGVEEILWIP
ncbi:MAG: cob(I)yrinic acid a,c-diamide adenosyltransferase [Alistipes sp.]|nr:cob(I)yrinic acid a,c-diamide adenosyltransferase [Alistipes sp.]